MPAEFDLIKNFFSRQKSHHPCNRLTIGDDCALIEVPEGFQLAVTVDTMVEGVHFFSDVNPHHLGHKLLAVNLSDLASMGAEPVAVTLALTIPALDIHWLEGFADGFFSLADQFKVDLIGGDTTQGHLTLSVQAMGIIPQNRSMLRSNAKVGDLIYVTGNLGDGGLGLKIKQGYKYKQSGHALTKFNQPVPRIPEGIAIRNIAHSCIDISDGLASDLGHILNNSCVGATIDWSSIPLSEGVKHYIEETGDWMMPLSAGDDYELCFTLAPDQQQKLTIDATCIGKIESESGLRLIKDQQTLPLVKKGYEHFA